jgi:hypothetical protein
VHVAVDAIVAEDMAALFRQLSVFEKRGEREKEDERQFVEDLGEYRCRHHRRLS